MIGAGHELLNLSLPTRPPTDAILAMWPEPRGRKAGSMTLVMAMSPSMFVSNWAPAVKALSHR